MKALKVDASKLMSHAASMKNPPKGYGSLETAFKITKYKSQRMSYWAKKIGGGLYTEEVIASAEADVVAEWGKPF